MEKKRGLDPGHDYWFVPAQIELLLEAKDKQEAKRKATALLRKVDDLDISAEPIRIAERGIHQPDRVPD